MTDICCYEQDRGFVLERFQRGEFDYIDSASEVVETEFFRYIEQKSMLTELAESYPSPRKKHDVPVWFYLAGNMSMRLHGVHAFHAFPYLVRVGGMLTVFGPKVAHKNADPKTGDMTLKCEGFNHKNTYSRQTPCDQDYLRKFSKDTEAEALTRWFNRDVNKKLRKHKSYDSEGIFIGDGSYIFVPDNERYEHSVRMLFDEHGHPVDAEAQEKMTRAQLTRCRWRRCYKLVSLLHTDRARSFTLRVAMRVVPGNAHECPVLYELVDQFVADMGEGVMQRLILDRGFIDGAAIERCKREHGIDVLIPLKKNMEIYQDVLGLLRLPEVKFAEYQEPKREALEAPRLPEAPERIQQRERKRQRTIKAKKEAQPKPETEEKDQLVKTEVAAVSGLRSLTSCNLPVNVIVSREQYQSGREEIWMLLDTKPLTKEDNAQNRRAEYSIRVEIEEGHRQLKCFWDLTRFTSVAFSMVLNQIVFVTLTFNLLQLFLKRERPEDGMPRRTRDRILDQLLPTRTVVVIYCENRFTTMTQMEYTELLLTLSEEAKQKVLQKVKRLRRSLPTEMLPMRRL